jgi:transposase
MKNIIVVMSSKSKLITNDDFKVEDIDELIKECKVTARFYQRLIFIKSINEGSNISEASAILNVSRQTGGRWLEQFNNEGIDGLMPKFDGGKPSYLTDQEQSELKDIIIESNGKYTINDIKKIISDKFGVNYSYKQVWVIVRKKFGLNYTKAFPNYDSKPDTAREDLKKTLKK